VVEVHRVILDQLVHKVGKVTLVQKVFKDQLVSLDLPLRQLVHREIKDSKALMVIRDFQDQPDHRVIKVTLDHRVIKVTLDQLVFRVDRVTLDQLVFRVSPDQPDHKDFPDQPDHKDFPDRPDQLVFKVDKAHRVTLDSKVFRELLEEV
tara:strand:- start:39 stop:485 length:447 start_codon:yes stop_codon:yes gene_type:complete